MKRVLVVLPNWFGETLFATPFLRALRQQLPDGEVTTLGWPQCQDVLQGNPVVTTHLVFDERDRHRSLLGTWRLLRSLRASAFDTAFILRKSLTRSLLVALANVPVRVGFKNPKSGWLLTHQVAPITTPVHKAFSYLPLLSAVGVAPVTSSYDYHVSTSERSVAEALLRRLRLDDGTPLAILHAGANWAHKRWSPERFAAVGDRLMEHHRVHLLITGGPHDIALAEIVRRSLRVPATVLAGQTSVRELGALIERAALFISNDTGVLHIAAALKTPVVALYGPTSPALTGPLGDPRRTIVIHHPSCCPEVPCYHPEQPPHSGMASITVDEVYDASVALLTR